MAAARVALLITIAACSLGVFACLFAPFAASGETFFETYARLDIVMSLVCVALFLFPVLAAAGVVRAKLDRVTIWLSAVPFAFFGAFVALEYWGEIEAPSYVAAFLSALAAGSALALSLMARAAPDVALPAAVAAPAAPMVAEGPGTSSPTYPREPPQSGAPPAGWYPDPAGTHRHRYWDGRSWTGHTN